MSFLAADGNFPFVFALVLMLAIAALEAVAVLVGSGISNSIDSMLPADVSADVPDLADPGALSQALSWLHFGKVPALMLMLVGLTAFGLIGLGIQKIAGIFLPQLLPGWLAALPATVLTIPTLRYFGGVLARIIPNDETESVSEASFIGRIAVITLGEARRGHAAQARLRDQHGHSHYVMVEPYDEGQTFPQGSQVMLVSREGAVFQAIPRSSAALNSSTSTS